MRKSGMLKNVWIVLLAGLVFVSFQSIACAADPAPAAKGAKLLNDDCVKCHSKAPADIAAAGSKHKT
ncbi:MAG: hypothetical protein PHY09_12465, partial [Desulfuromonadaceae bacterium]|nr:hypothetical protein [Desulfuromonadaceae bacterium]